MNPLEQEPSVGVLEAAPHALLGAEARSLLDRLATFEAPYLKARLLADGVFESEADYEGAFREFKKYVVLCAVHSRRLAMISKKVDAVWHQFILFTKEYHEFCNSYLGRYLHHAPDTPNNKTSPDAALRFVRAYSEVFGNPPPMWQTKSIGDMAVGPVENAECQSTLGCTVSCATGCTGDP